jgi:hypothetical protein
VPLRISTAPGSSQVLMRQGVIEVVAQLNGAALFQVRDCFPHHSMAEMSLSYA